MTRERVYLVITGLIVLVVLAFAGWDVFWRVVAMLGLVVAGALAAVLASFVAAALCDRLDRRRETAEARQWQRFTGGGK